MFANVYEVLLQLIYTWLITTNVQIATIFVQIIIVTLIEIEQNLLAKSWISNVDFTVEDSCLNPYTYN